MSLGPERICKHIQLLTASLIEISLCNRQNFPSIFKCTDGSTEVSISNLPNLSIALKNIPYRDVYRFLDESGAYNFKMLDGALIQLMYKFRGDNIISHRLTFFPAPDLEEYQNNPDVYELDEIYAEVIAKNIVVIPVRFDFDSAAEKYEELYHPFSHLTLGQYERCRIPVSAPITPCSFIDFILRSFYNTAQKKYCRRLYSSPETFHRTISNMEANVLHINLSR